MKIRTVSLILVKGSFPNARQEQLFHCSQHWMAVIHLASQKSWPRVNTGLLPAWHTQCSWKGRAKILPNTHTLLNKHVGLVTHSTPGEVRRVLRFLSLLSFRSNCYFWGESSVFPAPNTAIQCHMNKQWSKARDQWNTTVLWHLEFGLLTNCINSWQGWPNLWSWELNKLNSTEFTMYWFFDENFRKECCLVFSSPQQYTSNCVA